MIRRSWQPVATAVAATAQPEMDRLRRMQLVVDAIWDRFGGNRGGVSWVGFYLPNASGTALVLGPRRDTPACSPIGLHGVCGRVLARDEAVIVEDVRDLGDGYIACDPRDRSELVVTLMEMPGQGPAVLDLDSHDVGAFSAADVSGLHEVLLAAGLADKGRDK